MSQALKLGYRIHIVVHTWLIEGHRLGILADAQASQCDSPPMCEGISHPKAEADDHDVI